MRFTLKQHPDSTSQTVRSILVEAVREQASVSLKFTVLGELQRVKWPPLTESGRADDLWRTTCCEAFVREGGGEGYREFNFSPSTQWAAYQFDSYRTGTREADAAPVIEVSRSAARFVLRTALPELADDARLGLCVVIEEISGEKSYWALAHAPGKPDFHHAAAFAAKLRALAS